MEDGILSLCESSLATVGEAGATVDATQPRFAPEDLWVCWTTLRHSGRSGMRRYYDDPEARSLLKPELAWEIEQSMTLNDADVARASQIHTSWQAELDRLFGEYDFLAVPTAQVFPYPKETHWPREVGGRTMDTYHRWMEVVILGSLGGLPIINVPVGFDAQGRPMGMQVMANFGEDRKVLQFGLAYEEITDFLDRRPNLISA